MLTISEFGVIVAKDAVESGVASQSFYLASVIALAVSAFLSSCLVKFEQSLPKKMVGLIPSTFRFTMERVFTTIRDSMAGQSSSIEDIRFALWEFIRRVAIIFFCSFLANFAVTFVTPVLPTTIRGYIEAVIAIFALAVVLLVALRLRRVFLRLSRGVATKMAKQQKHIGDIIASILYVGTLVFISVTMIIVSYVQVERFFNLLVGKEGASPLVFILIAIPLILLYRYILAAAKKLEGILQITE